MKLLRNIIIFLSFISLNLPAQSFIDGGMGYAGIGLSLNNFKSLEQNFVSSNLNVSAFPLTGMQIGGGGFGLIHGKVILGGHRFANVMEDFSTSRGFIPPFRQANMEIAGGGGGFEVGIVVYNQDKFLMFPKLGVGGYGINMEIENLSSHSISFGNYVIERQGREELNMGGMYLDLGFQVHHLFGESADDGVGGFGLGLAVGYSFSVFDSGWEAENQQNIASGLEDDAWNAFYIKLLIGGGGFSFK